MSKDAIQPGASSEPRFSRPTAGRFSLYLRHLQSLVQAGAETISSSQLGEAIGVTDAQVRKDLAYLGHAGFPGVGYYPQALVPKLREKLGLDRTWNVVLVGAGNLARALLRYRGFHEQGFHIVGVFDNHPLKIGETLDELIIASPDQLAKTVTRENVQLGIITVPAEAAQSVADLLVQAGVKGILNFAPIVLRVPPQVSLVAVDLTTQLEQLAFLVQSESLCS